MGVLRLNQSNIIINSFYSVNTRSSIFPWSCTKLDLHHKFVDRKLVTVNRCQRCGDALGALHCGMGLEDSGQARCCQTVKWTPAIATNIIFEPKLQDNGMIKNKASMLRCLKHYREPGLWTVYQKAIYIEQIICLLGCVIWHEQKCKLTEVLVSSPDTTAYLSPVSPLPDVHESPNDVHSPSPSRSSLHQEEDTIRATPGVDSQVCCTCTQIHTYAHIDTYT